MWSPALSGDRRFWLKWLRKYKSFKCLWDNEERKVANRAQINEAYQELTNMAKSAIPDANISFVKTRLHAFRSCYKREVRKVRAARKNGIHYEPQLFYYNVLKFLDDEGNNYEETETDYWYENDAAASSEEDPFSQIEIEDLESNIQEPKHRTKVFKNCERQSTQEDYFEEFDDMDTRTELSFEPKRIKVDEYDIFGKRIAEHFRKMTDDQSLIAEKLISELCVYGRLKTLSMETRILLQPQKDKVQNRNKRRYVTRNTKIEPEDTM